MPQHSQTIQLSGNEKDISLAVAFGTLVRLGWNILYTGQTTIIGQTVRDRRRKESQITVELIDDTLHITSQLISGQIADFSGRTKHDVAEFINAFESTKATADATQLDEWNERLIGLRTRTSPEQEREFQETMEVEKVMRVSAGSVHFTYGIIAINFLIFILMAVSNVNILAPTAKDIIRWGGNLPALTANGQWWRLITNVFVHIGLLHILFNMYGLFFVGRFLEPMLGKSRYIIAYFCAGLIASLVSLYWHRDENMVSAGASGAIFGMYGLFLALLTTHLIPKSVRQNMIQSTAIFVGYNLYYGMKDGVDNSAHIGGLLAGMIIGYVYYFFTFKNSTHRKKLATPIALIAVTVIVCVLGLGNVKTTHYVTEKSLRNEFEKTIQEFAKLEKDAMGVYSRSNTLSRKDYVDELSSISLKNWKKAQELFTSLDLSLYNDEARSYCEDVLEYCRLNEKKTSLLIKIFSENSLDYNTELNETDSLIEGILRKFEKTAGESNEDLK